MSRGINLYPAKMVQTLVTDLPLLLNLELSPVHLVKAPITSQGLNRPLQLPVKMLLEVQSLLVDPLNLLLLALLSVVVVLRYLTVLNMLTMQCILI